MAAPVVTADPVAKAVEIAGSHTNGTMEDAGSVNRDIKGHMLFEVSTEVANRGEAITLLLRCRPKLIGVQWGAFTLSSNQKRRSRQQSTETDIR